MPSIGAINLFPKRAIVSVGHDFHRIGLQLDQPTVLIPLFLRKTLEKLLGSLRHAHKLRFVLDQLFIGFRRLCFVVAELGA